MIDPIIKFDSFFFIWFIYSAVGSLLIVLGLYSVLWGKSEEVNKGDGIEEDAVKEAVKDSKNDMELQSYVPSNGNNGRVIAWRRDEAEWDSSQDASS